MIDSNDLAILRKGYDAVSDEALRQMEKAYLEDLRDTRSFETRKNISISLAIVYDILSKRGLDPR